MGKDLGRDYIEGTLQALHEINIIGPIWRYESGTVGTKVLVMDQPGDQQVTLDIHMLVWNQIKDRLNNAHPHWRGHPLLSSPIQRLTSSR